MRNPAHLVRSRHAIFYFRWPLPKSAHPYSKPSALKHSLETREPLEALRLARYLGPIAETITAWGIASGMRYDEIRKALRSHFTKLLDAHKARIAEHGRLKTDASRRLVQVHPKLIELGLLDYVEDMRAANSERLFPELTFDRNNGWGRNLSHWFNKVFLVRLGLKSPQLVFHSFRHCTIV